MASVTKDRAPTHSGGYELAVVLLLGLAFGFAYFDRMAMTFLSPYVVKDLGLSNTQVGALGSGLSVTWALGAYLIGRWSDAVGRRKPFLLGAMVIFSFCSVLSGLAPGFWTLFASRMVMGAVEGPFLPICLAIIAAASLQTRRGLNVGIVQNGFGSLIGTAIAPIVLVWLADHYGWRSAFYLAGVPGLVLALLVWRYIREPEMPARGADYSPPPLLPLAMLANRNIAVCSLISCLMVGSLVIGSIFLPLFFTGPRGWEPKTMGWVMAVLGLTPGLGGVLVSWISDKVGRRPPMIAGCFLAAICPFAALWFGGSIPALAAIMFASWLGIGVFPLFMGVVPGETLGHAKAGTAMGLVVAVGELSGGFLGPLAGGALADRFSLEAPLLIQGVFALLAGVVAFALIETNPRVLAGRTVGVTA
uniref:MFS transporter n=1 Tax=Altererythrobacter segetis TaxID=1104773 RepID=UPI00140DF915|nr:MFS transporter [Altererythrobacter segetis]